MGFKLTAKELQLRSITEAQWQATVIQIMKKGGFLVYHDNAIGPFQNRAGFPDCVFVRANPPKFLIRELKREVGKLRPEQVTWLAWLNAAGVDAGLWRPSDIEEVFNAARK